ncbi:MAG: helix-hairpin-helix domain-containing protein [Flavobacteriales bacterium]|nr:helix-hairpin-helix domain-containing protein [Flavobacteriales bacterium]
MARTPDSRRAHNEFARRPVKEQVKELLAMHTAERRGTIIMILVLCGLSAWVIYEQWLREPDVADLAAIEKEMQAWMAQQDTSDFAAVPVEPFPFDPNTIDRRQWKQLGLTDRQIDGLERYKAKGGRFRTKGDLARMYTIESEQYERLKPFILLPDTLQRTSFVQHERFQRDTARRTWSERGERTFVREPLRKVEVNTADTTMLVALPGIGPSFARGIVKYRESLGGYHSLDQLAEVFVLQDKPDAVARLKEMLVIDTLMVRRIHINACTVEELAAHPYARWRIAKPLIAYRGTHGPFRHVADVKGCALVTEEVFRKLAPYLSVE